MALTGIIFALVPIALQFGMFLGFLARILETLVELDVEYRDLALKLDVPGYFRVPTQNADTGFIASLAGVVRRAIGCGPGLCSGTGARVCRVEHGGCPFGAPPPA